MGRQKKVAARRLKRTASARQSKGTFICIASVAAAAAAAVVDMNRTRLLLPVEFAGCGNANKKEK